MESKVSHVEWEQEPYLQTVSEFEANKPRESLAVGLVEEHPDPYRPGWVWQQVRAVVIPKDDEYECRTSAYLRAKPAYKDRVIRTAEELELKPKLNDHCQPVDVLSDTDVSTAWKHEEFYGNTITGSYNRFHRFFRLTEAGPKLVSWSVRNAELYSRSLLAHGKKVQHKIRTSSLFVAGAGGIGWKFIKDATMKGVGRIDVGDPDRLDYSNLSRIDVPENAVGRSKAMEIQRIIQNLRPNILCDAWSYKVQEIPKGDLSEYDAYLVFTDNVVSRCYVNRLSLQSGVPSIQVGANLENGRAVSVRTVVPGLTPCYECNKTFTLQQMQRDYFSPKQLQAMKMSPRPYALPSPVPSIVDVNSIAAGYAGEALFRLLTNQKIIPQLHLDVKTMELRTYEGRRDPDCRACSNLPDSFITNEGWS